MSPAAFAKVYPQKKIIFGIIPIENQKTMFSRFLPLAHYLSQKTGLHVSLKIGKDYQNIIDKLGKKTMHMAYLTPTAYPIAATKYRTAEIKPVVRFLKKRKSSYRSCIITHIDNPAETLEDLKNQSFAFGSKISTSSYLIPRLMLIEAQIDPDKDLSSYNFFGSHTNVLNAVIHKNVYAGGINMSIAEKYLARGQIKIIAISDPLPQFPICVNNQLTEENKKLLTDALLQLNDGSTMSKAVLSAINKKFTGCETTRSQDYDIIRKMIYSIHGSKLNQPAVPTKNK